MMGSSTGAVTRPTLFACTMTAAAAGTGRRRIDLENGKIAEQIRTANILAERERKKSMGSRFIMKPQEHLLASRSTGGFSSHGPMEHNFREFPSLPSGYAGNGMRGETVHAPRSTDMGGKDAWPDGKAYGVAFSCQQVTPRKEYDISFLRTRAAPPPPPQPANWAMCIALHGTSAPTFEDD